MVPTRPDCPPRLPGRPGRGGADGRPNAGGRGPAPGGEAPGVEAAGPAGDRDRGEGPPVPAEYWRRHARDPARGLLVLLGVAAPPDHGQLAPEQPGRNDGARGPTS